MTPLGYALANLMYAEQHNAGQKTIEERAESVEKALRDLIRKELVILNLLAERNPVD